MLFGSWELLKRWLDPVAKVKRKNLYYSLNSVFVSLFLVLKILFGCIFCVYVFLFGLFACVLGFLEVFLFVFLI